MKTLGDNQIYRRIVMVYLTSKNYFIKHLYCYCNLVICIYAKYLSSNGPNSSTLINWNLTSPLLLLELESNSCDYITIRDWHKPHLRVVTE